MKADFNSVWVVVMKWHDYIKEDDVIFFDYDDAVFYCEQKNQEDYNKSNNKDNYSRAFSVKTLYESMCYIVENAEKNGYDDGRHQGYDAGYDDGIEQGRSEGER